MTLWDDRFTNHAVFSSIETVRARLGDAAENLTAPEPREGHARLEQGLKYIERVLSASDPALTPLGPLNSLQNQLAQVDSHLQQFLNSKQVDQLIIHANNQMDSALHTARQLPVPEVTADVEGLREDVTRFRQSAAAHLRYLQQDFEEAKKQLQQELKTTLAQLGKTESQIETRLQELNTEKQRLDKAIADFQEQFRSTEAERASKFSAATDARAEQFRTLVGKSESS